MNYRHIYHAGNFADVFKHALLTRILLYLMRKSAPLRYVDTHAGIGAYDLSSPEAQRGGEWREGVSRLAQAHWSEPALSLLRPYLDLVASFAPLYPGSPLIAQKLLRAQDRLILCEAHPQDAPALKAALGRDRRSKAIEIDGYMAMRAYAPPPERRGLILIDPPYEASDEFENISRSLVEAFGKWPGGVYAIWRPLKDLEAVRRFDLALCAALSANVLRLDLAVGSLRFGERLAGSSLLAINPPYTLADEARMMLPELCRVLAQDAQADWSVRMLRVKG